GVTQARGFTVADTLVTAAVGLEIHLEMARHRAVIGRRAGLQPEAALLGNHVQLAVAIRTRHRNGRGNEEVVADRSGRLFAIAVVTVDRIGLDETRSE